MEAHGEITVVYTIDLLGRGVQLGFLLRNCFAFALITQVLSTSIILNLPLDSFLLHGIFLEMYIVFDHIYRQSFVCCTLYARSHQWITCIRWAYTSGASAAWYSKWTRRVAACFRGVCFQSARRAGVFHIAVHARKV